MPSKRLFIQPLISASPQEQCLVKHLHQQVPHTSSGSFSQGFWENSRDSEKIQKDLCCFLVPLAAGKPFSCPTHWGHRILFFEFAFYLFWEPILPHTHIQRLMLVPSQDDSWNHDHEAGNDWFSPPLAVLNLPTKTHPSEETKRQCIS